MLMDTTVLEIACTTAGMLPSAIEDGVRRLQGHFATQADPTPDLISQQLALLREQAPHLFPRPSQTDAAGVPAGMVPEVWRGLSPSSKLSWAREHGYALKPVERRAQPMTLTSEQAAALAQLPAQQRLTAYREMQAQQQRP
jgi:hypothetical protein